MGTVLRLGFQRFEVFEWHECPPGRVARRFEDRRSTLEFLRPFLRDPLGMMEIRRLLYGIADVSRMSDHQLLEQLAWQLVSGRLKIAEPPPLQAQCGEMASPAPPAPEPEPPPAPEPRPEILPRMEVEKSWIEIELFDEEDRPVANMRYRITLPDGRTIISSTNDKGWARVDGFDPGKCQIEFPDLDDDIWGRA